MKKVLSFVGCALFVAAMTVSCGHKNAEEAIDSTMETVEEAVEETNAACCTEATANVDRDAMLSAAREAGQAKCNCYKTDAASVESCIKSILAQSYAAYQDNEEFKAAMNDEFNKCVKEKATEAAKDAGDKAIKAGANALAEKLNSKK